jgi:hypothetical protein
VRLCSYIVTTSLLKGEQAEGSNSCAIPKVLPHSISFSYTLFDDLRLSLGMSNNERGYWLEMPNNSQVTHAGLSTGSLGFSVILLAARKFETSRDI